MIFQQFSPQITGIYGTVWYTCVLVFFSEVQLVSERLKGEYVIGVRRNPMALRSENERDDYAMNLKRRKCR